MHVASRYSFEKKNNIKLMGIDPGSKTQEEFRQHSTSVTCQQECLLRVTSSIRKHEGSGHLSEEGTEDNLRHPMRHRMSEPSSLLYHKILLISKCLKSNTEPCNPDALLAVWVFGGLGGGFPRGGERSANTSGNGSSFLWRNILVEK